jgi:ribose transport system substrate-binding protein
MSRLSPKGRRVAREAPATSHMRREEEAQRTTSPPERTSRSIRLVAATALLAGAAVATTAEATTEPPGTEAPDGSAAGELSSGEGAVIGFSQANNGDVWRINQTNNVEEYCAELMPDAEIIVTDGQGDGGKQSADVDDLVARGVDVLLLTPLTADELTPAAERALDADIPVITMDRAVNAEVTQHIGADNQLIGQRAAQFIAETVLGGEGGSIIEIQGVLGASATTDRHDAFVAWLEENAPDVEIVESQTGEYRREPALTFMNDMLQRFGEGEFDVVYAHNDEMALGAVQALETAGREGDVEVVGIDGQNEAIQAIADGRMAATFTYDNAGREACQSAQLLLSGQTIEPEWVLETTQIDETNAEEWIGRGF